jgi:hypothetical protein
LMLTTNGSANLLSLRPSAKVRSFREIRLASLVKVQLIPI